MTTRPHFLRNMVSLTLALAVFVSTDGAWAQLSHPRRQHPRQNTADTALNYPGVQAGAASGLSVLRPLTNTASQDQALIKALESNTGSMHDFSGVSIQVGWNQVEKDDGSYDWSTLDALFEAAQKAGKWVYLLPIPGFYTPSSELNGVKTDRFHPEYGQLAKSNPGEIPLPMPWDTTYLNNWFGFLQKVHDKYNKYSCFLMIAATGPTSVSAEMTMPEMHKKGLPTWVNDGYTSSLYAGAWQSVFAKYATIFPNQYISLTVGDALNIGEPGDPVPDLHAAFKTRQEIINQAISSLGSRFMLQNANLVPGTDRAPETEFVMKYAGLINTGLEFKAPFLDEANPPAYIKSVIDLGMQRNDTGAHVNFLNIYQSDVVDNPSLEPDMDYAYSLFQPSITHPIIPSPNPGRPPGGHTLQ